MQSFSFFTAKWWAVHRFSQRHVGDFQNGQSPHVAVEEQGAKVKMWKK